MQKAVFLIICLVSVLHLHGQRTQIAIDPRDYIDTAIVYMDQEQYGRADEYFMSALDKIDLLSADFCYFFGKNSLLLGKNAQSIDWLNKYLELKGSRGQYSKEVLGLLETAEERFRNEKPRNLEAADVNAKFFYLNTIPCDNDQPITCPVCKGQGVIITKDKLGERLYKTCPYSTNGVLTCREYNLLIQGLLETKEN
jgi:tetratricopeptide (TPR) repeat protein